MTPRDPRDPRVVCEHCGKDCDADTPCYRRRLELVCRACRRRKP
jgi:hypothetical protein